MVQTTLSTLDKALSPLHEIMPLIADQATRPEAAYPFTVAFFNLYTVICAGIPEAERVEAERFLTGSAHLIESALPFLDYNLSDRIEARLAAGAQAEDWSTICQLRSTLEALKELYAMHLPVSELIPDDPELDQALKNHANPHATGKPPKGFPEQHWWWAAA